LAAAAALRSLPHNRPIAAALSLNLAMAMQRPGVAVVVEMLQKPLRKMADDPAASGP
jgi:hypothetical protein